MTLHRGLPSIDGTGGPARDSHIAYASVGSTDASQDVSIQNMLAHPRYRDVVHVGMVTGGGQGTASNIAPPLAGHSTVPTAHEPCGLCFAGS